MFPVTRPFRQGLATLALVVLTVLPTAFVAAWAWRIHRPGHIRDVEIELGRQLGLQVTIDSVHYPRPGEVVFRGIVLRQEEPRGGGLIEIARADVVKSVRGDRELTLHAENLQLRGGSPRQALAQVGSLIQKSTSVLYERINLAAPSCRVDLGLESLSYAVQDVAGEFVADRTNPTLRLAYRVAGPGSGTRCELTLARDRSAEPVRTALVFKTVEGVPLAARVLDVFFETGEWLGAGAKVEGTLSLGQHGAREWEAEFQGNLLEVDLATLVGKQVPPPSPGRPGQGRRREGPVGRPARPGPRLDRGEGGAGRHAGDGGRRALHRPGPRDEVPALPADGQARPAEDRARVPLARHGLRHAAERRDPPVRGPGQRVHARRRARERHLAHGLLPHGHGQRARTDQDPVPRSRLAPGHHGAPDLRVPRAALPARASRDRREGGADAGGELIQSHEPGQRSPISGIMRPVA